MTARTHDCQSQHIDSVSPKHVCMSDNENDVMANECDSDGDDEQEGNVIRGGEDPERLVLPRDNEVIRKVIDPKLPSKMEIDMYNLTHLPYRNWCPICVRSKGKDMNHCDSSDKQRVVSEYCLDYCFPGDEFGLIDSACWKGEAHWDEVCDCGADKRSEWEVCNR